MPGQASQDANTQQINEQRAAFLAPPVFADLSMPNMTHPGDAIGDLVGAGGGAAVAAAATEQPVLGSDHEPVLWEPFKPSSGGSGPDTGQPSGQTSSGGAGPSGGGPAGPGGPSGPGGGNGWLRFGNRNGPSKPSSGRWRLMVAGAGIAAIVVAALVGWDIYSHTQTTQALNSSQPGATGAVGSTPAKSAAGGSAKPGGKHGTTPAAGKAGGSPASAGHSPSAGKPSAGSSRKISSSPGASTRASTSPSTRASQSVSPTSSPSASPTPTPTPTPSPSGTAPVLPPGYVWHDFSAAQLTSTAGFKIGLPSAWTQSLTGQVAHFNQPARNFHLTVSVGVWTYATPLAEAKYLNKKYAAKYNGYKELALGAVGFNSIGGFKAAPAAELKFSWDKSSGGNYTELVILTSLDTKAGVQTYWFSLWAPSATFTAAHGVFHTALKTFRPLPAT
jgi:hypothetical protein